MRSAPLYHYELRYSKIAHLFCNKNKSFDVNTIKSLLILAEQDIDLYLDW